MFISPAGASGGGFEMQKNKNTVPKKKNSANCAQNISIVGSRGIKPLKHQADDICIQDGYTQVLALLNHHRQVLAEELPNFWSHSPENSGSAKLSARLRSSTPCCMVSSGSSASEEEDDDELLICCILSFRFWLAFFSCCSLVAAFWAFRTWKTCSSSCTSCRKVRSPWTRRNWGAADHGAITIIITINITITIIILLITIIFFSVFSTISASLYFLRGAGS
ncbi:hypothetical protein INR49_022220 [Caranx melampygus]|nr:hypothetical protein INR49_022220 [Caranx melampygus]